MAWDDGLTGIAYEIAKADTSPLRVMAGPGTGKTFALKRRVARLIEEGADPSRILAVTFTRTAAESLCDDLHDLGIPGCTLIKAGTLHSYCFSLLSKEDVFDFSERVPRPLITINKSGIIHFEAAPLLEDLRFKNPNFGSKRDCTKRIRAFEAAWARLQSEEPGWPRTIVDREFHDSLISWLQFHNTMLIGELVPEALNFLKNNPASPELEAFDHIIVDEYQDLNKAEQKLIDILAEHVNHFVVGDEDQSIYRFRFAHPEGIAKFDDGHPGTHDEELIECRRCPKLVVELASNLIARNHPARAPVRLNPFSSNPNGEVKIIQWKSIDEEAEGVAQFVGNLINDRGYSPADILILSPRRQIAYPIRNLLKNQGIQAHSFYNEELLEKPEAQEAFSLLTLLIDTNDRVALRFWLGFGSTTWRRNEYEKLRLYCHTNGVSPWNALSQIESGSLELKGVKGLVGRFKDLKRKLIDLEVIETSDLIDVIFPSSESWAEPIRKVIESATDDEMTSEWLHGYIKKHATQPELPSKHDFVRIMSLHKSKGLTSKVVLVVGCVEGIIPTRVNDPKERAASLKEQRRLFYVAVTRCRDILLLSSVTRMDRRLAHKMGASLRPGPSSTGPTITSRFIGELGPSAPSPIRGDRWVSGGFK